MRPKITVKSKRVSPLNPLAMAQTSHGISTTATADSASKISARTTKASRAKPNGSSPRSNFLENIGTKAMLNAPSAKKRRNKLGRENATTKASATGPVPKNAAIITSRANPSTRDIKVQPPTVKKRLIIRLSPFQIRLIWLCASGLPERLVCLCCDISGQTYP